MREINGTVKISLEDYNYLVRKEKRLEEIFKSIDECIELKEVKGNIRKKAYFNTEKLSLLIEDLTITAIGIEYSIKSDDFRNTGEIEIDNLKINTIPKWQRD